MSKILRLLIAIMSISSIGVMCVPPSKKQKQPAITKKAPNIIETKGSFDSIIDDNEFVVLDFTATWCGPCQTLARMLPDIAMKYPQVKFIKVDADVFKKKLSQYNVTCFPTLLFLKNGKEVHRMTGFEGRAKIEQILATKFKSSKKQ